MGGASHTAKAQEAGNQRRRATRHATQSGLFSPPVSGCEVPWRALGNSEGLLPEIVPLTRICRRMARCTVVNNEVVCRVVARKNSAGGSAKSFYDV
jgi:hypothetical protein